MAEADRDAFRREQAQLEREKEIMKDVPGWEVSTCIGPSVVPLLFNSLIANSHNPCSFFRLLGWQVGLQHEAIHSQQLRCTLNRLQLSHRGSGPILRA